MKKIIFFAIVCCLALGPAVFAAPQQDEEADLVPPIVPADRGNNRLVDTDISALKAKVSDLERRLNDIERDRRFDQDRARQLERDVNDLRRRTRSLP